MPLRQPAAKAQDCQKSAETSVAFVLAHCPNHLAVPGKHAQLATPVLFLTPSQDVTWSTSSPFGPLALASGARRCGATCRSCPAGALIGQRCRMMTTMAGPRDGRGEGGRCRIERSGRVKEMCSLCLAAVHLHSSDLAGSQAAK